MSDITNLTDLTLELYRKHLILSPVNYREADKQKWNLNIQEGILTILLAAHLHENTGISTSDIRQRMKSFGLKIKRNVNINANLYRVLEPAGIVSMMKEGPKPIWRISGMIDEFLDKEPGNGLITELSESPSQPDTAVFIDLGNVHDCLEPAADIHFDDMDAFILCAYADAGSNAPGTTTYGNYIKTDSTGRPNAADVAMIIDALLFLERTPKGELILVSNDRIFATFASVAEIRYLKASIVVITGNKAWSVLREYIE